MVCPPLPNSYSYSLSMLTAGVNRMTRVCETWSLEELCDMDEDDMENLLSHYAENKVMTYKELRGVPPPSEEREVFEEAFDGSFGWF